MRKIKRNICKILERKFLRNDDAYIGLFMRYDTIDICLDEKRDCHVNYSGAYYQIP